MEEVDFIIGGDGSKMLDLLEMVESERLQDRVELLGAVPHADVPSTLRRGDVFLNCSLTESFCIAILEAASTGLLVVSTNVGGVPEVLPPDMILLAQPTVPDLVRKVKEAVSRMQKLDEIDIWRHRNHNRVSSMYSWERVCRETIMVYKGALRLPRKSFSYRIARFSNLGGVSGLVAVLALAIVEVWFHFVVWWQPESSIDIVPDLT